MINDCGRELALGDDTKSQDWLKIQLLWLVNKDNMIKHGNLYGPITCPSNTSEFIIQKRLSQLELPLLNNSGSFVFGMETFNGSEVVLRALFKPNKHLIDVLDRKMGNLGYVNKLFSMASFATFLVGIDEIIEKYIPKDKSNFDTISTIFKTELSEIFYLFINGDVSFDETMEVLTLEFIFGDFLSLVECDILELWEELGYRLTLELYEICETLYGGEYE